MDNDKDLTVFCNVISKLCDKRVCPLALIGGRIAYCSYNDNEKSQFETDKEKNNEQTK